MKKESKKQVKQENCLHNKKILRFEERMRMSVRMKKIITEERETE